AIFALLIRKSKKHRYSFLINGFSGYRYYRATGYHFHLARIARNHVIRGLYLLDIALQASPFLASILERDQY
ncbi:TPA: hypothetical protein ACHYK1_003973, partial [Escherichia coli]